MSARIRTPLTDLLGIELPIVQAPIGGASTPELAAAVSRAGGFGVLSITWHAPDRLHAVLSAAHALTRGQFGVNLVLAWDPAERLAIALEHGARLISLSWGDPAPWIARVHQGGALVAVTVGSADEARRATALGADVIVAQGIEAGGHVWGRVSTLALVPAVVDAIPGTPVVAAGGIVDGRGLVAALGLGAAGAWIGTRFVASAESAAHDLVKQAIVAAPETATHLGELFDGGWPDAPLRALRNSTVCRWEEAGCPPSGSRPGEGEVVGMNALGEPVQRYSSDGPLRGASGDLEAMVHYAGQGCGVIHAVQPAGAIVREIAADAERRLRAFGGAIR